MIIYIFVVANFSEGIRKERMGGGDGDGDGDGGEG